MKSLGNSILPIKIAKDSVLVFGIRIFSLVFQLAVFALITRSHSLREVGIYALVNTVWIIARQAGSFGYDQAAMRFIPEYLFHGKEYWAYIYQQAAIQRISRKILIGTGMIALIGFVVLTMEPKWHTYGIAVLMLAAGLPAYSFMSLYVCLVRARGQVVMAQVPESICIQLGMTLGVGSMILTGVESVEYTLAIQMLSAWVTILIYRRMLKGNTVLNIVANTSKPDMEPVNAMAFTTFKAMLAAVLAARLPVILLSFAVSVEMLGLFEAALRFGILASITTWAVGIVVSPSIANAAAASDSQTIQRLYAVAGILQTIPALLLLVVWIVFGETLLGLLLGEQFRIVHNTVVIIAIATTVNAAGSVASNYLLMTKGEKTVQLFSILALMVVLIGIPIGVMLGGIEGAAWALVVNSLVRDIGMTIVVVKTRGLLPGLLSYTHLKWMILAAARRIGFPTAK